MNKRLTTFLNNVKSEMCDGIIIESKVNREYLIRNEIEEGILFIAKNHPYLLVDQRYAELARDKSEGVEVVVITNLKKQLKDIAKKHKIKNIGVETEYITLDKYKRYKLMLDWVNIYNDGNICSKLIQQRAIKTDEEIEKIKIAQELTDEAFEYILNYIKPGVTERAISIELERYIMNIGAEGKPFDFIVVSGANTSIPHGKPTTKEIERGDFVTLDFGAKVQGYCSDMTRTIAVGPISSKQRKVYETVLISQQKAIKNISAGKQSNKIDKLVRDYIGRMGYRNNFYHALGHGVGLDVHEWPILSSKCEDILEEKNVVTIEPGIYIPKEFGVRIEDMIIVTKEGNEVITKSNKELIFI